MHVDGTVYVHEQAGSRMRVSFRHTRKQADGSYEVQGYSHFTVWLVGKVKGKQFSKGELVSIDGALKVTEREYQGEKRTDVSINAWAAERAKGTTPAGDDVPPPSDADAPDDVPPPYDDETPF